MASDLCTVLRLVILLEIFSTIIIGAIFDGVGLAVGRESDEVDPPRIWRRYQGYLEPLTVQFQQQLTSLIIVTRHAPYVCYEMCLTLSIQIHPPKI